MLRRLLATCCVLLALVGCNEEDGKSSAGEPDFQVTLQTIGKAGPTYSWGGITDLEQGEEIKIVLEIKNISAETKTLNFASSKQYDFAIKDDNGAEVWRWSNGYGFTQATTSYQLAPGESRVITAQWNQVIAEDGTLLPAGLYTIEADDTGTGVIPKQPLSIINYNSLLGGSPPLLNSAATADFQVMLQTQDLNDQASTTFAHGAPIKLVLSITNVSQESKTLNFSSAQHYDFVLKGVTGNEVWRWSNSSAFAGELSSYVLAPGETRIITEQWDQVIAEDGSLLPAGSYLLEADSFGIDVTPQQLVDITGEQVATVPSDFLVSLKTADKFDQPSTGFRDGELINITLTIKNLAAESKTLSFPSSKQYDFVFKASNGHVLWRWSNNYAFDGALSSYELAPGESRVITEQFDMQALQLSLSAGSYILEADGIGIDVTPQQIVNIGSFHAPVASDFEVTLKTTNKYDQATTFFTQGEPINITLSIKNISSVFYTLRFGDSMQYDFALIDGNGNEVWRRSHGYAFYYTTTEYDIAPGETKTFTEQWDQKLFDSGTQIAPGNYTLQADHFGIDVIPQQSLTIH